jgi:hypothetical protein
MDAAPFARMPFVEAFHSDIFIAEPGAECLRAWFDDQIEPIDIARDLGWLLFLHIYISACSCTRRPASSNCGRYRHGHDASYMFAGYLVSIVAPGHDGKIYVAALSRP